MAAGAKGRRARVAIVETASGSVSCSVFSRQGVVPMRWLGEIVREMA